MGVGVILEVPERLEEEVFVRDGDIEEEEEVVIDEVGVTEEDGEVESEEECDPLLLEDEVVVILGELVVLKEDEGELEGVLVALDVRLDVGVGVGVTDG